MTEEALNHLLTELAHLQERNEALEAMLSTMQPVVLAASAFLEAPYWGLKRWVAIDNLNNAVRVYQTTPDPIDEALADLLEAG